MTVKMVLDTGAPFSSVSESTRDTLVDLGLLSASGGRRWVLRKLRIDQQGVADLTVRLSRRVSDVGAEGVLGLDFLGRFTEIHFHVPSMRLTLLH